MSYSFTNTESQTFSYTHARHLASKVATDLKRMQRFYGSPIDADIDAYEAELVEFLKMGYMQSVTYGFIRNGAWIEPTLHYTAKDLGNMMSADDDPGRVRPGANISGASFSSFLAHSLSFQLLLPAQRIAFGNTLPFQRSAGNEPGFNGFLTKDKTYASGGKALERSYLKS